jgi:hypothetical protein
VDRSPRRSFAERSGPDCHDTRSAELHGNAAPGAAAFDRSNNVEQINVPISAAGQAKIAVRAFRTLVPQPYALVVRVS